MDALALARLLTKAERFNEKMEITGLLVFANRTFLQTIEGPSDAIGIVYNRISKDTQHASIRQFLDAPIEHRMYPNWAMMGVVDSANTLVIGFLRERLIDCASKRSAEQLDAVSKTIAFLESAGNPAWLSHL